MGKDVIPQTPDEFTARWFSDAVFAETDARVTEVPAIDQIGSGIGFLGALYRCSLTWDRDEDSLPSSVVVKVPTDPGVNRSLAEAIQAYEREIVAYRDLGEKISLPMPKFYYGACDPNPAINVKLERPFIWLLDNLPVGAVNQLVRFLLWSNSQSKRRYLLVIEDIEDARPPSQVSGQSLADVEAALDMWATFHARHWMDTALADASELIWSINRTPRALQAGYVRNRADYANRFSHVATPAVMARLDAIDERSPAIMAQLGAEPWTISHGDCRLDNILFRQGGHQDDHHSDMIVVDYQLLATARPGFDIAYFITTSLSPDHRSHEPALLRRYHDALASNGVSDYSYDDLVTDCSVMKDLLAHRLVATLDNLDTQFGDDDNSLVAVLVERTLGWLD